MKKPITEERVFCDYCGEPGYTQCIVCGKDLCSKHRVELVIYLDYERKDFRASLCADDAKPLLPFLESLAGRSTSWEIAGQNPQFNEARLAEIIGFLILRSRGARGAAEKEPA